jgi:hypothetical protein
MAEITPETIRAALLKLMDLYGEAADAISRLCELHERAQTGEDVSAERAAGEERLRELEAKIKHARESLKIVEPGSSGGTH